MELIDGYFPVYRVAMQRACFGLTKEDAIRQEFADEYAICSDRLLTGGLIVYGKYDGVWKPNPSPRFLIRDLLDKASTGSSADYWRNRCEKAEAFIEACPCDHAVTKKQAVAYSQWQSAIKKSEKGKTVYADFGFAEPHRTKSECENPAFADKHLHRIAIVKDFHVGSPGDVDQNGMPGWVSKYVCTGCGKQFKIRGFPGLFHPDYQPNINQ